MRTSPRILRRLVGAAITVLISTGVLAPVPVRPAFAQEAPIDLIVEADPASDPYQIPPPPPPLSPEQTLPVIDLSELEGIWPEEIVETLPATVDPASPAEAIEGTTPLLGEGEASMDAFATEGSEHVALIYPGDVNAERPNGTWPDLDLGVDATADGWAFTDPTGSTFLLPAVLSTKTPVVIQTPSGGTLTLAPAGEGSLTGESSGDTVTYPGAFGGADLIYTASASGLQERIVLGEAPASATFGFHLTLDGLQLVPNEGEGLDVIDTQGAVVGILPAPLAYDSSPEPASAVGAWSLTEEGDGTTSLVATFDEAFFAEATYPVTIDPTWNDAPNRDAYTSSASASTSYETSDYLKVGPERTYIRFDTDAIEASELIVYGAELLIAPTAPGGVSGGIEAHRVTGTWPSAGTLNWSNQPAIGSTSYDTPSTAGTDTWWHWNLTDLYQHYLDTSDAWNTHFTNQGVALTAANPKTFYSVDAPGTAADPLLYVTYNRLPYAPVLDTPANNFTTATESFSLSTTQIPNDPNGDDVMVSFQISDDGANWTGTHLVFQSPFDDAKRFTVPSGILLDGNTYHWRAVSRDVCDPGTGGLCSLTDGAGTVREPNASGVRAFTVQLEHLGTDGSWAMWSRQIGNGASVQVNQATGNLYVGVPLGSYATPIGPLGLTVSYNSLDGAGHGLSPGWDLALGPRGTEGLPIELTKLEATADADIKIRFSGGRVLYFPHAYGKVWGATSAMSGYAVRADDDTWTYFDPDGGVFGFSDGVLSGARLLTAKPAASGGVASAGEFTYAYDASLQLQAITDPLGRKVNPVWGATGLLDKITAPDFGVFRVNFLGHFLPRIGWVQPGARTSA